VNTRRPREQDRLWLWEKRPLNRRQFLGLSAAAGTAFVLAGCGGDDDEEAVETGAPEVGEAQVEGDTPGERAIAGIRALNLPSDFSITVFSEDLSILGPEVTKAKFEEQAGFRLDLQRAPFLEYASSVFNDATTRAGTYDVVLMETNRMGDLDAAGYLTDLTPWVQKYDPGLDLMPEPINRVWPVYGGKYVGLPTDGDTWILYYRKDLMEDPANQEAFQDRYDRELSVPETWDEYNELIEFFTRPDENLYGAVEWRVRGVTYWWFWQRLWSAGGRYFDDEMSAAINSAEGVQALEDLKTMNEFMAPDVLSYGYVETVEAMSNGSAFSNITWPAAGKAINNPETSQTVGQWGYTTVPGYAVNGSPNKLTMSAPGYNCIVSAHSKKDQEACYLYAQWYTSPENLKEANLNLEGNTDVLHTEVFDDPEVQGLFEGAEEYLQAQRDNLAQAVPDPIIPGYSEYTQALEIQISDFMTGNKSAQEALDTAAEEWNRITDSFDREQQQQIYESFLEAYGQT
jgi:multiple sugar transport system substrate-binding protein